MNNLNAKHSFQKAFLLMLLAGFSYFFLDQELFFFFKNFEIPLLKIVSFFIFPPLHLAVWGIAFIIARIKRSYRTLSLFEIIVSQCLSAAFVRIFKIILGRARPEIFLKEGAYGFYGFNWDHLYHSFPSGHALTAFTLATSLSFIFPRMRTLIFSLATLFSLSRTLLLDHYFSDVISAAAIGITIANFVHIMINKIYRETV